MVGQQLSFALPARIALGRDVFFVSENNALALSMIDSWHLWPGGRLLLHGPEGSGKTHLTHVWAALSGAEVRDASALREADIPSLARAPLALEDADGLAGDARAEASLFHLYNMMQAEGHALLLTARTPAAQWGLTLPDLSSRMAAVQSTRIAQPDDALLGALMSKLFDDRQLRVKPDVIAYLVSRMERSFSAALRVVGALDAVALAQNRPITRALAAQVLAEGTVAPEGG